MVIPIHDENPTRTRPVVTWVFLVVNVVAFLIGPVAAAGLSASGPDEVCGQDAYFREYGAIPDELLHNAQLDRTTLPRGTQTPEGISCAAARPGYEKEPALSVLTAMFLHGGWLHLAGNMLFLWVFGNNVEDRFGHVRFALFYLACGLAATYAFALLNQDSTQPLVGASGAIAGVLGAYLLLFPRAKITSLVPFLLFIPLRLPAWLVLGTWFVLQWAYAEGAGVSQGTGVAYSAHVAGFLVGLAAVGLGMGRRRSPPPRPVPPPWPY
ncbi:MAG: rhomboid family intramembrane serine protease [Actinomycetes bacterium]